MELDVLEIQEPGARRAAPSRSRRPARPAGSSCGDRPARGRPWRGSFPRARCGAHGCPSCGRAGTRRSPPEGGSGRARSSESCDRVSRSTAVVSRHQRMFFCCWQASRSARSIGAPVSSLTCSTRGTECAPSQGPVEAVALAVERHLQLFDEELAGRDPAPPSRGAEPPPGSTGRRRRARCRRRAARACLPGGRATIPPWRPERVGLRGLGRARHDGDADRPSRAAARAAAVPAIPVPRTRTSVESRASGIGNLEVELEGDVRGADRVGERADGDAVGARQRVGADRFEPHVAGRLEPRGRGSRARAIADHRATVSGVWLSIRIRSAPAASASRSSDSRLDLGLDARCPEAPSRAPRMAARRRRRRDAGGCP